MVTILGEGAGTCGLCRKEDKPGVRCEVDGIGQLFLDWRCLQRMVSLKTGGVKQQPNCEPAESR